LQFLFQMGSEYLRLASHMICLSMSSMTPFH
jgi:hypothetical protein